MRLLIAGWQGQIAQALIEAAPRRADVEACAVGRPALDICTVKSIERAMADVRPDVVINTAAYTDVDRAETEPARAMALNEEGARLLAVSAAKRGVPIIQLSTDYVFGDTSPAPYVETDATRPTTAYGRSKLAGEAAVAGASRRHVILRTAWVYSPFGRNFVTTLLADARAGKPLGMVADRYGSPTYAPHLADVILAIASTITVAGEGGSRWGVFHAAGSGRASWYEIACEALRLTPDLAPRVAEVVPITAADYPTAVPRPHHAELDCTRLEREFGLRLPHWRDGVAACVSRLTGSAAV